jgi:putative DNA primase/helicase
LAEATDELGLAEGIETALAVHIRTGKPIWATISAGNMEKILIPDSVRRVCIYADNDANSEYDGQASAYVLARRLKKEQKKTGPREVEVFVPKTHGEDWADVWLHSKLSVRKVA